MNWEKYIESNRQNYTEKNLRKKLLLNSGEIYFFCSPTYAAVFSLIELHPREKDYLIVNILAAENMVKPIWKIMLHASDYESDNIGCIGNDSSVGRQSIKLSQVLNSRFFLIEE